MLSPSHPKCLSHAAIKPMLNLVPLNGLLLLLAGDIAYTGGIGFYLWRSLPYHHAIWHLLVLAGSAMQLCSGAEFRDSRGPWGLTPDSCEPAPGHGYLMPE